jgi:hypothetical protein
VQGEVARLKLFAGRQRHCALERVFQLAHVARKIVLQELGDRGIRQPVDRRAVLLRKTLEDSPRDQRDVFPALTQRWHS